MNVMQRPLSALLTVLICTINVAAFGQETGWIQSDKTERVDKASLELTYMVRARALNFRPQPSTESIPLRTLQRGEFLSKLGQTFNDIERREWYQVIKADGEEGWVASEYLTPVRDAVWLVEGAAGFISRIGAQSPAADTPAVNEIRAGFVYVGPVGDAGWTYQHDLGRKALEELPYVTRTSFVESIPEDDQLVGEAIEGLVSEGHNLIFTTSYGYMDPTIQAAKKFDEVVFMHASGFKTADNAGTYFGRMYQARFLTGVVAGSMTQSDIVGYVAAFPIPEVVRGINAFTLGAQSVNPDVQVRVLWTHTWYGPGVEREQAEKLLDYGADVLTMHQDSPAVVQAAEQRNKFAIGYHSDMSIFAPNAILTSAVWDWGVIYRQVAEALKNGTWQPNQIWWGLTEGVVRLAPLSNLVPKEMADLVVARQQELVEGRSRVFEGPIRDSDGVVRVPSRQIMTDADLLTMDFFVLGVKGELESATGLSPASN